MAYVPPAMRSGAPKPTPMKRYNKTPSWEIEKNERIAAEKADAEKRLQIASERSDTHFPSLGGGSVEERSSRISYGGHEESWKKQRAEDEHNKRVEQEFLQRRAERNRRLQESDDCIRASLPFVMRTSSAPEPEEEAPIEELTAEDDGWTVVKKKERKPRKDAVDFNEVPEDIPIEEDDEEYVDECVIDKRRPTTLWN